MKRFISFFLLSVLFLLPTVAQENSNSRQARQMFERVYSQMFGDVGASFHYKISILGIYSTEGDAWYKGKMKKEVSKKNIKWNDGVIKYEYLIKDDVIKLHDPNDKKDKLKQKFNFTPDDYTYSVKKENNGDYRLFLKLKPGHKGMKEIHVFLDSKTRHPKRLRIKVSFFWANLYLSNYHPGISDESIFVFPKEKYKHCKVIDER